MQNAWFKKKKKASGCYFFLLKQVQFFHNDTNSNVFNFLILSMISHPRR